ncbi:MAG: ydcV 2, partial [Proteobacteria bacterium]|nr:ydcV 2 [Pseudomonadota bacterium]
VILSLADLTIAMFLAGRTQPLSLMVASEFRRELRPDLNAMQVVVLVLTAVLVGVSEAYRRRRLRKLAASA